MNPIAEAMKTKKQWKRIGTQRRGGVATPLFSVYSESSIGIGELPDLKLLIDWCRRAGLSIIQLLPMNDVGFKFTPYDAQSTFALEPMYLSLGQMTAVDLKPFEKDIESLKSKFPAKTANVDYGIKAAKLKLLLKMFKKAAGSLPDAFYRFTRENQYWLEDFVTFKVIKDIQDQKGWESWPDDLKHKQPSAVQAIRSEYPFEIKFHQWLQWQIFEQFRTVKKYAGEQQVLLMGDLPFLVARDSADVWAHQNYFKLDFSSGAPPDLYFARGQRWGMPPYNWEQVASHQYDYIKEKLKYADHFYDLFRIDHVIGVYRLWSIPMTEPEENAGLNGTYDPEDEARWEEHGRWLLSVMADHTEMLPCGEDLGTVPKCSNSVLEDFGIPGMDVQRWQKDWGKTYDFLKPDAYRSCSIAVISTHDMTPLGAWWRYEAGTVNETLFRRQCEHSKIDYDVVKDRLFDFKNSIHERLRWNPSVSDEAKLLEIIQLQEPEAAPFLDFYRGSFDEKQKYCAFTGIDEKEINQSLSAESLDKALRAVYATASVFSIQLLQDFLALNPPWNRDKWEFRINFPGTFGGKNWSLRMPCSLEEMLKSKIASQIKRIQDASKRV